MMFSARNAACFLLAGALGIGCVSRRDEHPSEASESAEHAGGEHDDHGDEHGDGDAEGRIVLSAETIAASGIEWTAARSETLHVSLDLPGEVVTNADRLAHIVPRFAGIAKRAVKALGDPVERGEVLAIVESNESLSPYEVTSLISGTVIEKHITLGEFVRDDADIYVVADLSTVWVNVTAYARDLPRIARGQRVRVVALGGAPEATASIDYVGPVLGEATRAATARVVLPNREGLWRPGMFVTARIVTDRALARVAVPDEAVQRFEGGTVVFVREGDGFALRAVRIGRSDASWTEILEGLEPGETYVARGGFILKSELLKSEAGHEH